MLSRWLNVLLLFALGFLAGCSKPGAAAPTTGAGTGPGAGPPGGRAGGGGNQKQVVEVAPITRRDLVDTLTVIGSLAANESADIRPEMSGLVQSIGFDEGQVVKKGHVLLKIEDTELRAQYARVEAGYQLAQLSVERSENLRTANMIAQSELDRARSEFAAAKAELELLRTRLDKTDVKAPFDGVVSGRAVSPGDYVTTQTIITTLDDISRLKVEFSVPERYSEKVTRGTTFQVRSSALESGHDVRGDVYFVSPVISRETRSSEIKGFLDNPPPSLRPGMFAEIDLVLEVRKAALTVPEGSILVSSSGSQLITVREEKGENLAEFVPVTLGMRAKGLVEVTATNGTLAENTSVVASGVGALIIYPGARLDPRPLREEFQVSQ